METFFVRVLTGTLLVAGFVTLLGAVAAAGFGAVALMPALLADTADSQISVRYNPISSITGFVPSTADTGGSSSETFPLKSDAARLCQAQSALISYLSNNQFSITDLGKCSDNRATLAENRWGTRAQNYLAQAAAYWAAIKQDPQVRSKYSNPNLDEPGWAGVVSDIDNEFNDKFDREVANDDRRKSEAQALAIAGKASAIALGTVAVSAFLGFLVVAFLIVAIRIERHLAGLERKAPNQSGPGSGTTSTGLSGTSAGGGGTPLSPNAT
jgi:hypothetical protein